MNWIKRIKTRYGWSYAKDLTIMINKKDLLKIINNELFSLKCEQLICKNRFNDSEVLDFTSSQNPEASFIAPVNYKMKYFEIYVTGKRRCYLFLPDYEEEIRNSEEKIICLEFVRRK